MDISQHQFTNESMALPKNLHSVSTTNNIFLPNGQRLTVRPVFGGFSFKSDEVNAHKNTFPAAWTVILQTEEEDDDDDDDGDDFDVSHDGKKNSVIPQRRVRQIYPYRQPTLQHDNLFISSISNPQSHDSTALTNSTKQVVMMLWTSLYWYFHQKEPSRFLLNKQSKNTPVAGKPKGEWRINIKQQGILRGRHLIQKLERMGLVTSEDSSVGTDSTEKATSCWRNTFTSRRAFWQISAKYFLSSISTAPNWLIPGTPYGSRPNSPVYGDSKPTSPLSANLAENNSKFTSSGSNLQFNMAQITTEMQFPVYYPPAPLQYVWSSGVRHPLRPKPPSQGEIFYTRYIPSVGQYLSFRTASLSEKPILHKGPISSPRYSSHHINYSLPSISLIPTISPIPSTPSSYFSTHSASSIPSHIPLFTIDDGLPSSPSDLIGAPRVTDCQLLNKWMNIPRVSKFWGCNGPISRQEDFLRERLEAQHSFPIIGLWDEKPFGYFEIYWAKEDILGRYISDGNIGDWDRGIHVLVGEDEFRGKHRVKCWLTSLAHWVFTEDYRTNSLFLEPRVDNERFISYLQETDFLKEREISFPHKQSALMRLRRDQFEGPFI